MATLASGSTKDYPHVLIHEGDKRGTLSKINYFVDVPVRAVTGATFQVDINGEVFQVVCPDITKPGQRIVVTLERPEKFIHE